MFTIASAIWSAVCFLGGLILLIFLIAVLIVILLIIFGLILMAFDEMKKNRAYKKHSNNDPSF